MTTPKIDPRQLSALELDVLAMAAIATPPGDIRTIDMLASFGVQLAEGLLKISDRERADLGYVHHSRMPVAMAALAQIDPYAAYWRYPKMRLADLVAKRPSMDGAEAIALGAVCGVDISRTMWPRSPAPAFRDHLHELIERRHVLGQFFGSFPDQAINGIDIRPLGVDHRKDQVADVEMKAWRRDYRKLSSPHQMMVATILWLYRGGPDKLWLQRCPCGWPAGDAIRLLKKNDMLADWGKLVALYPGW